MSKIIKNIRKNSIIDSLKLFIPTLLLSVVFVILLFWTFGDGFNGFALFLSCVCAIFLMIALVQFCKKIVLIINPFNSAVFKKYGDIQCVENIYREIEATTEHEDDVIIVSKNFLCDKRRAEVLIACDDVVELHKVIHARNLIVVYVEIVITDKFGDEHNFMYKTHRADECDSLLNHIAGKCKNAVVGYTQNEFDHI